MAFTSCFVFPSRCLIFACFNFFSCSKAWPRTVWARFCFGRRELRSGCWDIVLPGFGGGTLLVEMRFDEKASNVWDTFCAVKNSDCNWWWMRSSCITPTVERLDRIVKGVIGVEDSACTGGIQISFFLRILRRLLEYCSIGSWRFQ